MLAEIQPSTSLTDRAPSASSAMSAAWLAASQVKTLIWVMTPVPLVIIGMFILRDWPAGTPRQAGNAAVASLPVAGSAMADTESAPPVGRAAAGLTDTG